METLKKLWEKLKNPRVHIPILIAAASAIAYKYTRSLPTQVKLSAFFGSLTAGKIKEIVDYGHKISYATTDGIWMTTHTANLDKSDLLKNAANKGIEYSVSVDYANLIFHFIKAGALTGFLFYFINKKQDEYKEKKLNHTTNVRFADVAGCDEAKRALREVIDYFRDPQRYNAVGAKLPKGILMYGPSGTGKTLLAKATAGEAGVNFISTTGSEFVEMYVGMGARRVRDTFKQARENAPCILFIDEIEGIAIKRSSHAEKSSMEYHSTLNQLLTEMDGFHNSDNIVVIGATNKQEMLDEAVVRPGRLDWKILVNLPDETTRFAILRLHLYKRAHTVSDSMLQSIAKNTDNFSGAELEAITNEASFEAVRSGKNSVSEIEIKAAFKKACENKLSFRGTRSPFYNFK